VDINKLFFIYLLTMHSITLRCTINIAHWFSDINCYLYIPYADALRMMYAWSMTRTGLMLYFTFFSVCKIVVFNFCTVLVSTSVPPVCSLLLFSPPSFRLLYLPLFTFCTAFLFSPPLFQILFAALTTHLFLSYVFQHNQSNRWYGLPLVSSHRKREGWKWPKKLSYPIII